MSFIAYKNKITEFALIIITIGIVAGTGSCYRYAFNYNLIMAGTLMIMTALAFYRYFIPLSNPEYHIKANRSVTNYLPGMIVILFLIAFPMVSDVFNLIVSYEIMYFHTAIILISFLIGAVYRRKILDIYLHIIVILSVISFFYFFTAAFFEIPDFVPKYPKLVRPNFVDFYYLWSAKISPWTLVRNQSIFWEPGGFGYHLMLATTLAVKKKNRKYIYILVMASLTTMSTTVYLFLVFIGLYQLIWGKSKFQLILVSIGSIVTILILIKLLFGDFILPAIALEVLVDKFSPKTGAYNSFLERSLFTVEALKMFLDNFIFGAGHYATAEELEVIRQHLTTNTSGLAGLLAEFGLFGVFCIYLYIRFFRVFKIMAIPIALIWLNGEFLQYSPLSLFILAHEGEKIAARLFPVKTDTHPISNTT
jgi:hypothetical protein